MESQPRLISIKEISERTSLSKPSVHRLIRAGQLRPVRIGTRLVIPENEFEAWLGERMKSRPPIGEVISIE
ncbi:MAG: helix-turn-helix domain-containing protein [Alphaproteobacteria bacterium]|nr:helix-turn-helix domain-containing protein [Alphaproteobacteria bacterium]MBU2082603.1 helix-turn-helix domain-containing protein [Alphaproteobacteria bacterium]MBU2142757.1 helix-turn-helix domain-containing protein [Alphaproteobacteria bacterium]MBU2195179.1 helix-turn-helix domain-containing protein [Alphaproteobacteria bacterium]